MDFLSIYERRLSSLRINNDIRMNSVLGISDIHIDILHLLLRRICNETLYLSEDDNDNESNDNEKLLFNIRRYIARRQDLKKSDIDITTLTNISNDMLKRYEQSQQLRTSDKSSSSMTGSAISSNNTLLRDPLNSNIDNNLILSSELFLSNVATFQAMSLKRKSEGHIDSCIELLDDIKKKRSRISNENIKLSSDHNIGISLPLSNNDLETIYTDQLLEKLQKQLQCDSNLMKQ